MVVCASGNRKLPPLQRGTTDALLCDDRFAKTENKSLNNIENELARRKKEKKKTPA